MDLTGRGRDRAGEGRYDERTDEDGTLQGGAPERTVDAPGGIRRTRVGFSGCFTRRHALV